MLFVGFGCGLVLSPTTNLGISNVSARDAGAASGVVNAAHWIGASLGIAAMVHLGEYSHAFIGKVHIALFVACLLVIFAILASAASIAHDRIISRFFHKA